MLDVYYNRIVFFYENMYHVILFFRYKGTSNIGLIFVKANCPIIIRRPNLAVEVKFQILPKLSSNHPKAHLRLVQIKCVCLIYSEPLKKHYRVSVFVNKF